MAIEFNYYVDFFVLKRIGFKKSALVNGGIDCACACQRKLASPLPLKLLSMFNYSYNYFPSTLEKG